MRCAACNKELTRKEAMFTKERDPYCPNPFNCESINHPNSVKNIVARGGAVPLYTDEQIEFDMLKNLDLTPEMRDRIQKVATKPQSIRLNRQDIAYYLLKLQETHKMASISEAVRYCVNFAMENSPIETKEQTAPTKVLNSTATQIEGKPVYHHPSVTSLTGIIVPDVPKVEKPKEEEVFEF